MLQNNILEMFFEGFENTTKMKKVGFSGFARGSAKPNYLEYIILLKLLQKIYNTVSCYVAK